VWASSGGGDAVTVAGSGLVATGAVCCRFTDITATGATADPGLISSPATPPASATWTLAPATPGTGSGSVRCVVPAMGGASLVAVDVSLNGQQFSPERLALPLVADFAPSVRNSSYTVGPGQTITLDTTTTATVAYGNASFVGVSQVSTRPPVSLLTC
jgi:hypothetical protein